jgi:hypothetical protein
MRGQRLPMFDKWSDAMNEEHPKQPALLGDGRGRSTSGWSQTGEATTRCSSTRYCDLYPFTDDASRHQETIQQGLAWYPLRDNMTMLYFVISHGKEYF